MAKTTISKYEEYYSFENLKKDVDLLLSRVRDIREDIDKKFCIILSINIDVIEYTKTEVKENVSPSK